jgi:hypothetical protein
VKALFIHRGRQFASARIRILELLPYLEALGVETLACEHPATPRALHALLAAHRSVDAIVLQKKLPNAVEGWVWRSRVAPLIFDFDDAVMFRQFPRRGSHRSAARARRFRRVLALADAFVCGNDYLASFALGTEKREKTEKSEKPVRVAPSPVRLDVPVAGGRSVGQPARIGWLGSAANLGSLASLGPALRRLAARRDFVLVVISERDLVLPGVATEHMRWSQESQEQALAGLDVGLMPLADSPWSRGKCAYKLLQYMAAGLPVIASPVGMNRSLIEHGRNGLLASSDDEWLAALERLLESPDWAAELAASGRRTACADYAYERLARTWQQLLAGLTGCEGAARAEAETS